MENVNTLATYHSDPQTATEARPNMESVLLVRSAAFGNIDISLMDKGVMRTGQLRPMILPHGSLTRAVKNAQNCCKGGMHVASVVDGLAPPTPDQKVKGWGQLNASDREERVLVESVQTRREIVKLTFYSTDGSIFEYVNGEHLLAAIVNASARG